ELFQTHSTRPPGPWRVSPATLHRPVAPRGTGSDTTQPRTIVVPSRTKQPRGRGERDRLPTYRCRASPFRWLYGNAFPVPVPPEHRRDFSGRSNVLSRPPTAREGNVPIVPC